jgi:hypothetical protein
MLNLDAKTVWTYCTTCLAFHSACNPINVITSFRNAGIVSQLRKDGTSMAGADTETCQCLLPSDTAQNDPNPLREIQDEVSDTVLIPVWLQFLEMEAAVLMNESG